MPEILIHQMLIAPDDDPKSLGQWVPLREPRPAQGSWGETLTLLRDLMPARHHLVRVAMHPNKIY